MGARVPGDSDLEAYMAKRKIGQSVDLGTVTGGQYSDEVDLSSFTQAVVYVSPIASDLEVEIWFSPTRFDHPRFGAAVWYRFYQSMDGSIAASFGPGNLEINSIRGTHQVMPFPPSHVYLDAENYELSYTTVPQRVRFKPPTGTDLRFLVEGSRMIS